MAGSTSSSTVSRGASRPRMRRPTAPRSAPSASPCRTSRAHRLALARLHVPAYDQAHGPGECSLPAVRGVGGSLIEFVAAEVDPEAGWMQDFQLAVAPLEAGAGLTRIDHFTQTVAHVDLLSWLLFYKS